VVKNARCYFGRGQENKVFRPTRFAGSFIALFLACGFLTACQSPATGNPDTYIPDNGNDVADFGDDAVDFGDDAGDPADVNIDGCPDDPAKTEPGICGCGIPDTDTDNDSTPDCHDGCPANPDKILPGLCGCDVPDTTNCAEIDPPAPDPIGWLEVPYATSTTSISMVAETVTDLSGVEYYFECTAGACHDSGWQGGPVYQDNDLAPDNTYAYRVIARDLSPNYNQTGWSTAATAKTDDDPGYATGIEVRFFDFDASLSALPVLSGIEPDVSRIDGQIAYAETEAPWTDLPGGFADTFASRHGGFLRIVQPGEYTLFIESDNGSVVWLNAEPILDNTTELSATEVSVVRQLEAGYHPIRVDFYENEGPASLIMSWAGPGIAKQVVPATAFYHANPPDILPPTPDPAQWDAPPAITGAGSVLMEAAEAVDVSGVQYYFECTIGGCHDSGWIREKVYWDIGLDPGTQYAYRVKSRDFSLNENTSLASEPVSCTTDTYVPDVVGLNSSPAAAALAEAALLVGDVDAVYSDFVPVDTVLDQNPAAGTLLPAGSAVALTLSLGPEMVEVPDVVDLPQTAAEDAIVAARLAVGTVTLVASCHTAPGSVVSQQPVGGVSVPNGSAVNLVVSKGPEQVVITELMYHPVDDFTHEEFLELYNPCTYPADIQGWKIQGLGTFTFEAGAAIAAEGYVVVAEDGVAFEAAYGFSPDFVYSGASLSGASLSNDGELLKLIRSNGTIADELTYDDLPSWPVTPDGLGPSLEVIDPALDNNTPRNWHASIATSGWTPRAINSVDAEGLPPWITTVGHGTPAADVPITVTAVVIDAATVTMTWVLNWGEPVTIPMTDDGQAGDGAAGDGVFGAVIPGQPVGSLIRYRIDAIGPTGSMGFPRDDDTVMYTGTYIAPEVSSGPDVFHWIINPTDYDEALAHCYTDLTEPALLFHNGVLYDGLEIRVRGQSSRVWPKKHWNFKFKQGHDFNAPGFTVAPVGGFNLQSSYADKSYLREILSYETFRDAGSPSHIIVPVAVYQNGQFFGLYNYLEDKNASYLERNGLDPDGGFYKSYSQCTYNPGVPLTNQWEKVTPEDGDYTELGTFLNNLNNLTGQARRDFLFDNVDLAAMFNYQAVSVLIHNNDQVAKNYFLYRDTNNTQRWSMQAWDMDLTFGRSFQGAVLNDEMFADVDFVESRPNVSPSHPLFGDSEHQKWDYLWNRFIDALLEDPDFRQMYYRRLRSLMDQFLVEGVYEARIDQLAALIADVAEMDRQKWGWYGAAETPAEAVTRLKEEYLAVRRVHLFTTHQVDGEIPTAQSASPIVVINELMYNPFVDPLDPADNADELEFIELYNPSPVEAIDVSGWTVIGVSLTIPPGSVILPQSYLLLVRNDVQFRLEYGPGHFVAAQYTGRLAGGGERVALVNRAGVTIDEVTYDDSAPWPTSADGSGPSLELIDPSLDNRLPASWAASLIPGGTPGAANSVR
jgi:hypothetical protein